MTTGLLAGCQRGGGDDGLLIGRLFGNPSSGCIWVGRPRAGIEVDWPGAVTVDIDHIRVSGPDFIAQEGDWLRMQGGTDPANPIPVKCRDFAPVPGSGRFVPHTIEYFGDERPSAEFTLST